MKEGVGFLAHRPVYFKFYFVFSLMCIYLRSVGFSTSVKC